MLRARGGMAWVLSGFLLALTGSAAALPAPEAVGLRLGRTFDGEVKRYELFVRFPLPWQGRWDSGWRLDTQLGTTAGTLRSHGVNTAAATGGPLVLIGPTASHWRLDLGVAAGLLEDDQLNGQDFGGTFQFTSHLGLRYRWERWELGYRVQHTSNADLYSENTGLDMQAVELAYRLP